MGGGGSKQQSSVIREIDAKLDAQFTAHCNSTATSIQEITLEDVNIIAKENCKIRFMNKASLNSSCDMGPILDAIAEMAVNTNQEFAKTLQDTQDRQANMKCDADNCEDKIKVAITKKLTSSCESRAKAEQTMKLTGATIYCDGNSVAEFGNFTEVRATCLRSLLLDGLKETDSNFSNSDNNIAPKPPEQPPYTEILFIFIISGAILLFVIYFKLFLFYFRK